MPAPMPMTSPRRDGALAVPEAIHVAVLGFSAFERAALVAHFKLADGRIPSYEIVLDIDDARFVIADSDQSGVGELLHELGRTDDAVFVGASGPPEAAALIMRPIDPSHVMRELDRLLEQREHPSSQPMPLGLPSGHGPLHALGAGAAAAAAADAPSRRADDAARGSSEPARRRHRPLPPPALPVRRALLVDDSEIALHFLHRMLEPYGVAADFAYDSAEALERLAALPYGIVFLDVDLGEGSEFDGLELCKQIKQRRATVVGRQPLIVLVSAFNDAVHRVRGTFAGADAFLAKPLDRVALDRLLTGLGLPGANLAPALPT
jgi:two-component system, cell cycle response regulator